MSQTLPDIIAAQWRLEIAMHRESGGPVIARESVLDADLGDVTSELWMHAYLRKHRPDVPLDDVRPRIVPLFASGRQDVLDGYHLDVDSGGKTHSLVFSISSLRAVVVRASQRLIQQGVVADGDRLHWDVTARCREEELPGRQQPECVIIREIPRPLDYVSVPIRLLQEQAQNIGTIKERDFPVFYLADALLNASDFAREGAKLAQPVETGAALLGQLCSCPETGEFFAVVLVAEPLEDAEEKRFSLSFSARTWHRIQSLLETMRKRPESRAARLLGEAHGHPFVPQELSGQREGDREWDDADHTAFVSEADIIWSRAVFSRAPFQLNHIFGKTAAGRDVHALYGLRNGTLAQRGYAMIRRFEPEWIINNAHS